MNLQNYIYVPVFQKSHFPFSRSILRTMLLLRLKISCRYWIYYNALRQLSSYSICLGRWYSINSSSAVHTLQISGNNKNKLTQKLRHYECPE